MTGARDIIEQLASQEGGRSEFLAPVVRGNKVRAKVDGLVRFYAVDVDEDGFYVVHPVDEKRAAVVDRPRPALVERYLELLPRTQLVLVRDRGGGRFQAIPWNTEAGAVALVDVVCVAGAGAFDVVVARSDGGLFFFQDVARNVDDRVAAALRKDVNEKRTVPTSTKGLTPAHTAAFALHTLQLEVQRGKNARQKLIDQAALGGARVVDVKESGDVYQVHLITPGGNDHVVAIRKDDGSVASAGICLSGQDRDFDLASIVGVLDGY